MGLKRDVGVQSAPENVTPAKTPPIMERSAKRQVEADDSPVELKLKTQPEVIHYLALILDFTHSI